MDDILASIRRILNDEEKSGKTTAEDDVFVLDQSMMIEDKAPERDGQPAEPPPAASAAIALPAYEEPDPLPAAPLPVRPMPEPDRPMTETTSSDTPASPLVAPEAAAAAASSLGALRRTLAAERGALVRPAGPTIEDIVREEIRPMLKAWLDAHLPPIVEQLVKAEIEKVVGRSAL